MIECPVIMGRDAIRIAGAALILALPGCGGRDLDSFGPIPDFHLTAATVRGAKPVERKDLLGRPWIADFIFTSCQGPCPLLSANMARLQKDLPKGVGLLSVSVDPDHDVPRVLENYAAKYAADPDRWLFVTGDKARIYRLLRDGFKLAVMEDPRAPAGFQLTHSTKFVLLDPASHIRGYYDGDDSAALKRLEKDASSLVLPLP